jgi:anthranilate/para-aminobenzoate synthase component I
MPIYKTFERIFDPSSVYAAFRSRVSAPSVLLESARVSAKMGRYSLIAGDPFLILESKNGITNIRGKDVKSKSTKENPFDVLEVLLKKYPSEPGEIPFLGGALGFVGYESKRWIEPKLGEARRDDLNLPDLYFIFVDHGIVIDHETEKTIIFSKTDAQGRHLEKLLASRLRSPQGKSRVFPRKVGRSLDKSSFCSIVRDAQRYITEGDIFQANLSQRFDFELKADPMDVYAGLKKVNPSSFFGVLDAGDFQILSGSPERLLSLRESKLETRPIAGTRSRAKDAGEDKRRSLELLLNEKERAEHVMLVDLERNDLGRVCEYGSVVVDEFMIVEDYTHVKHIVSNVKGFLKKGASAVDALKAFFPGGTITGAPKVRCMEIIGELEPVARGPYTGSLGYFSFSGNMDFNIIIRSLVLKKGRAYLQVGAGIVADSVPEKEYDETLHKAESVLTALFGARATQKFFERCRRD